MLQFRRSFRVSNRTTTEVMQIGPTRRFPSLRMAAPHSVSAIAVRRMLSSPRIESSTKQQKSPILTRRRSSTCTGDSKITSKIDAPDFSEFFTVTSGRGVKEEEDEFAQRRCDIDLVEITQRCCEFNVSELAQHAARVVQADRCVNIKEFPDGVYNRTLLLSMDNGKDVIAKILIPDAGRPHFTIASEVATMKFAREVFCTDIPEVYDWSSKAKDTPVGAEFILMEKLDGVQLQEVWPEMTLQDRLEVVKAVAAYQKSWASVSFEQFGSLYFAEDVIEEKRIPALEQFGSSSSHFVEDVKRKSIPALVYTNDKGKRVEDSRFVVGPSTSREMFDNGRGDIGFNRGPWSSLKEYHASIGHREIACVQHLPHLPTPSEWPYAPGLYVPTCEKKIAALRSYLKLLKYLLPADQSLGSSHFWHDGIHARNIFVDPGNRTRIVGLIGWQSTELSPLYFHARQPSFIDHKGPTLHGLERPIRPSNYHDLEGDAKKAADSLYRGQALCSMYRALLHHNIPKVFECLEFQKSTSWSLLSQARNLLVEGELTYLATACELEKEWGTLPGTQGVAFPLRLSTTQRQTIMEDMERATLSMEALRRVKVKHREIFPENEIVAHDDLKDKLDAFGRATFEVLSQVDTIKSELLARKEEPE
ncbi:hypothetical protein E4U39_004883 [Claviceps sp. Clav50 group G5]|nr:hypothetical protein E4U39_004883 [Claviceps sp. Clav50 group G5]